MILDTSVIVAAADTSDAHHAAAVEVLRRREPLLLPEPVIPEADYMIGRHVGTDAAIRFLRALDEGTMLVVATTADDRSRAADLCEQYRNLRLGYVDAVCVALAERVGDPVIATLDRRHFSIIRPRHVPALTLIPE